MVKCVICDTSLLKPKHGVGSIAQAKIKQHYVLKHNINENRPALLDYLSELVKVRESDVIVRFCYCTDEVFMSKKQLALLKLVNGCDIKVNDNQRGGARVGVFDEAPTQRKKTRTRVLSDKDVDSYYQFSVEEYNISSVSLFELKYNRLIQTLDINDMVLPPLAFLDHAIEKLRNFLHREKYLVDVVNNDWFYGKMQMSLGINNTKDNSVLISTTQDNIAEVIDPELNFVCRPLAVTTLMSLM